MDIYQQALRPLLFSGLLGDEERLHHRALGILATAAQVRTQPWGRWLRSPLHRGLGVTDSRLAQHLWGLDFPNPLGLAAGFDKDGVAAPLWGDLGFGFAELGTVTHHPQPGNPQPRLFRLVADRAILNRMGFNNHGSAALAQRLATFAQRLDSTAAKSVTDRVVSDRSASDRSTTAQSASAQSASDRSASDRSPLSWTPLPWSVPLGINLGKSKVTPLDQAVEDYCASFRLLQPWGHYFVVNVSSPNTPGLRSLQTTEALDPLLAALQRENSQHRPLLVKISPDLDWPDLAAVVELVQRHRLAGIIATNTTIGRSGLTTQHLKATGGAIAQEAGGISGHPLAARSTAVIRFLWQESQGQVPIIGVGGVASAADAWDKITAGASLVQLYTGWIYGGPGVLRQILQGLGQRLEQAGMTHIRQAIGSEGSSPSGIS
ncbi:quinone-dependent dihydroorotate dehydrogenase [Prochlorothrix hollandica]|uniref:Dihydroorotate dehydrogenase (quinone) n=1 Tax=Prochlorothrix hollandica PCC 9006 = CALU 1027 TaxID=317619 RepID=A0A0M2PR09_PROHO|nr:quinone-dependent dihydroorotate dehydrogenase [Prochlorothrix hollandica]KKI98970.1 dihydroorotate dehydrogenase [Prochlorothrix hollandica PCC 9006 = CALU 1027]